MPVQPIKHAGQVVAYQARVGSGGPGLSKCFSLATHPDAEAQAHAALPGLLVAAALPARAGRTTVANSTGTPGITARYEGDVLRIGATWVREGRNCAVGYSVERNGLTGAVALAIAARERGARIKLGVSPETVLAAMQPHLSKIAAC